MALHSQRAGVAASFLMLNAAFWCWMYASVREGLDPFGDMVEAYAWGHAGGWGNNKHPPLSGMVAAAWFSLFPTTDLAFYTLTVLNQALGFWFVYLAVRRLHGARAALAAVMVTSLVTLLGPDTGFKFNANSALLPAMAVMSWALVAWYQEQRWHDLLWLGLAAGAAMLTKYFAAVFIGAVGFGITLALRPQRGLVLRAMAAATLGVLILTARHFMWAQSNGWPTLRYAMAAHVHSPDRLADTLAAFGQGLVVALLPAIAVGAAWWRARPLASEDRSPPETTSWHPAGLWIFAGCWVLTALIVAASGSDFPSKWLIPAWLFFGWALVDLNPSAMRKPAAIFLLTGILALYWAACAIAGAVLQMRHAAASGIELEAAYREAAERITRVHREAVGQPMRYVAGAVPWGYAVSFYSADHPVAMVDLDFKQSTWVDESAVRRAGLSVVCTSLAPDCVARARALFGTPARTETWNVRVRSRPTPLEIDALVFAGLRKP